MGPLQTGCPRPLAPEVQWGVVFSQVGVTEKSKQKQYIRGYILYRINNKLLSDLATDPHVHPLPSHPTLSFFSPRRV